MAWDPQTWAAVCGAVGFVGGASSQAFTNAVSGDGPQNVLPLAIASAAILSLAGYAVSSYFNNVAALEGRPDHQAQQCIKNTPPGATASYTVGADGKGKCVYTNSNPPTAQ